jgi:hydroxyethylthiazole kinase-like uncharacterized protein yjeF
MRLTTSKAMRDADSKAIHVLGIPSTLLMTNAAGHIAAAAMGLINGKKSAVIFCGCGNNGGDGVAAASYLLRRGVEVRCFLVGDRTKMTEDCAEMERRLTELGGSLEDFSADEARKALSGAGVVIDAMFGIGLNADLKGKALKAVELINSADVPVVAADIASGVEADSGRILKAAVKADVTVTFSLAKTGHFVEPGCTCCGQLRIADIGIPAEVVAETETDVIAVMYDELSLPARSPLSHKGDYGKLLVVGGSVGYTGAPVLCARAAARSGAGLVSLGVPQTIYEIAASHLLEPMPFPLQDGAGGLLSSKAAVQIRDKLQSCDACVIGCGLGRSDELSKLVRGLLCESGRRFVIDADGLYALGDDPAVIKAADIPPILTPHEGEFVRLGGALSGDRVSDARKFADERNCILVLKGHHTICAFPGEEVYIIPFGNAGMAKGGSGDLLAGIIGGLVVQLPVKQAVVTACAIHALAGDSCAKELGEYSMLPSDILDEIPEITKEIIFNSRKEWSK